MWKHLLLMMKAWISNWAEEENARKGVMGQGWEEEIRYLEERDFE